MGLDMSLYRAKRVENITPIQLVCVNEYFGYLERPDKYKDSTMKQWCGIDVSEVDMSLVEDYREYFRSKGMFENKVYPMIPEMLSALKNAGCFLFVATSKPEPFAKTILDHFNLSKYFNFIGGTTLQETRTTKTEVIQYVLESNHLDAAECLMVGDRCYDIEGAKNCNMKVAAVLFGYGDEEELKDADFLISSPMELLTK